MTAAAIAFPTIVAPMRLTLRGKNVVGMTAAPMSGVQQVQSFPGKWWQGEITWPDLDRARADIILAFLDELNGPEGTFLMGHPKRRTSKGTAASAPGFLKVSGGGQTGTDLNVYTTGLGDVDGYMLKGDMLQLGTGTNSRLYRLQNDVDLTYDAGTLTLWPPLRVSPADNQDVIISNPVGLFRLAVTEVGDETNEAGIVTIPTVPYREAL